MSVNRNVHRWFAASMVPAWLGAISITLLEGCAAPRASTPVIPAAADTAEVIAYPLQGQSERQIRQDRYECYLWAVHQSGYDPAVESAILDTPAEEVPDPAAGAATAQGAVTGAALGALVSGPRHSGAGATVGAIMGALVGASTDAERKARADAARYAASVEENSRRIESYRRALSACLDARGYSVR